MFEIYNTYKLEIKTFKLRVNNEQTIKFREKRKDKNITCKQKSIKALLLLGQAFIFTPFIIIQIQYINSKNLFKVLKKEGKIPYIKSEGRNGLLRRSKKLSIEGNSLYLSMIRLLPIEYEKGIVACTGLLKNLIRLSIFSLLRILKLSIIK